MSSARQGEPARATGDSWPRLAAAGEWRFAAAIALAFVALAGLATFHHEMWRDELQSWLIARDSASPLAILRNSSHEGHPPLWFLLLWPITRIARDPAAMQVVNVAIGASTAALIARFAPAPRWLRGVAALGYFPVYEYGAIARNYGVGLLGLMAFAALYPARRRRPVLLGAVLALTANSSLPACVLAMAGLLILGVDAMVTPGTRRAAAWAGVALGAAGVAASIAQMAPPPDTGFARGWNLALDVRGMGQVLETVTRALIPLPRPIPAFWHSDLLAAIPGFAAASWALALALLLLTGLGLARRPLALLFHLAATLGLLTFFYVKTLGFMRHWGFLFTALCVAVWIARTLPPRQVAGPLARVTKACERGLAAVLGTLGPAVYANGGRLGTYIVWDTARFQRFDVWRLAARLSLARGSPVVVVLDSDALVQVPAPPELAPALRQVGCVQGEIVPDESFCAWVLDPRGS